MLRRNLSEKACIFNLTVAFPAGVVLVKLVGLIREKGVIQDERGVSGVVSK